MADEADIASEIEQLWTAAALSGRERHTLPETGHCHNCDEKISCGLFSARSKTGCYNRC